MKIFNFKQLLITIFKDQAPLVFQILLEPTRSIEDEESIDFERLNQVIEIYQAYPLIIKKDKNKSEAIYSVFNTVGKNQGQGSLIQSLNLISDKLTQKYVTLSKSFRYFDQLNKGKIPRSVFKEGVIKLDLGLSDKQIRMAFDFLDLNRDGYLTYVEFCRISEENRKNLLDSFVKEIENRHASMDKIKEQSQYRTQPNFGIQSMPSDNMLNVITNQFQRDYVD